MPLQDKIIKMQKINTHYFTSNIGSQNNTVNLKCVSQTYLYLYSNFWAYRDPLRKGSIYLTCNRQKISSCPFEIINFIPKIIELVLDSEKCNPELFFISTSKVKKALSWNRKVIIYTCMLSPSSCWADFMIWLNLKKNIVLLHVASFRGIYAGYVHLYSVSFIFSCFWELMY